MALTTSKKQTNRSIMKSLYTGDTDFELSVGEMNNYITNCNYLKGLSALSMENARTLQKNVVILTDTMQGIKAEGDIIEERRDDLNDRFDRNGDSDDIRADRKRLKTDTKAFNEKKHPVKLFTIPEDAFPKKGEFGVKKAQTNFGIQEIDRYECFLELLGNIITEKS